MPPLLVFCLLLLNGCIPSMNGLGLGTPPTEQVFSNFILVTPGRDDTFEKLAQKYYQDSTLAWYLAQENGIAYLEAGKKIIIPIPAIIDGGVSLNGCQTVTVLCYHNFSESKQDTMTVSKVSFEAQMQFLKTNGYTVISMERFFDFLDHQTILPDKSVVITLDDGWRSAYEIAYPILRKYQFPATFFVYTDLITNTQKTLSWEMLNEMSKNGISLENHSKTHMNYAELSEDTSLADHFETIQKDLVDSDQIIRAKTGKKSRYFAYPYGETNSLITALLQKQGYRGALTVEQGGNPFFIDPFQVHRTMVFGNWDLAQFKKKIETKSSRWLK